MANKKNNVQKKDNRLMVLGIIAIVVILGFVAVYFINQSQNEAKIEDSQSTSSSNQSTGDKATKDVDSGVYGSYTPQYQATIDQLDDKNYQNIILPDDLKKKIDGGEGTFVYFFSPTCSHCQKTTPELMPLADKADIHIDQYNVLEFSEGWDDYTIEATPTLAYYKDGQEVGRIIGEQTAEAFNQFFDDMQATK